MACRVPVVGTLTGGIPESVVDGVTGLLVPPRDDAALAQAITRLLKDQALRTRLAVSGLQRVSESFGVERMVAETVRVYERFLSARA